MSSRQARSSEKLANGDTSEDGGGGGAATGQGGQGGHGDPKRQAAAAASSPQQFQRGFDVRANAVPCRPHLTLDRAASHPFLALHARFTRASRAVAHTTRGAQVIWHHKRDSSVARIDAAIGLTRFTRVASSHVNEPDGASPAPEAAAGAQLSRKASMQKGGKASSIAKGPAVRRSQRKRPAPDPKARVVARRRASHVLHVFLARVLHVLLSRLAVA